MALFQKWITFLSHEKRTGEIIIMLWEYYVVNTLQNTHAWLTVSTITIIIVNLAIVLQKHINKEKTEALSVLGIGNIENIIRSGWKKKDYNPILKTFSK